MVACSFKNIGGGGSLQNIDSLCTLNYNLLNMYLYTALWFVYALLVLALIFTTARFICFLWLGPKLNQYGRALATLTEHVLNKVDRRAHISSLWHNLDDGNPEDIFEFSIRMVRMKEIR